MFKLNTIFHFINTKFRDRPIDVAPPQEDWVYKDLESYSVVVDYKYAGPKKIVFMIDKEEDFDPDFFNYPPEDQKWFHEFSRKATLQIAQDFYQDTLKKIQQYQAKHQKHDENIK